MRRRHGGRLNASPRLHRRLGPAMDGHWNFSLGTLVVVPIVLFLGADAYAAANSGQGGEAARTSYSYASVSDADLTAIAARWDDLNPEQRRTLLSEVKIRMRRNGGAAEVLGTNVNRYGTVVRRSNGGRTTVRVEVRTVKKPGHQEFGVGFEQRAGRDDAVPNAVRPEPSAPAVKVADPDK